MNRLLLLFVLAAALVGMMAQASAQNIPNISGLKPHTAQTKFMSLAGFLRWQYFLENTTWLSADESNQLVKSQLAK